MLQRLGRLGGQVKKAEQILPTASRAYHKNVSYPALFDLLFSTGKPPNLLGQEQLHCMIAFAFVSTLLRLDVCFPEMDLWKALRSKALCLLAHVQPFHVKTQTPESFSSFWRDRCLLQVLSKDSEEHEALNPFVQNLPYRPILNSKCLGTISGNGEED